MSDFEHKALVDIWEHPETGVEILGEDMPLELYPVHPTLFDDLINPEPVDGPVRHQKG